MSNHLPRGAVALILAVASLSTPAAALLLPFESPPPDTAPPTWSGQGQSLDAVPPGETVLLFASLGDDSALAGAQLWTNETGVLAPVSGRDGSPLRFYGGPQSTLALFPWRSGQLAPGTRVAWKITFEDRAGRTSETPLLTFRVAPPPPPPPGPHDTTFTVCPSGCDFAAIQDAINAAVDGDTVLALNGTHAGPVVVNRSVTLRGESRDNTTVDGLGASIVVRMVNTSNVSDFAIVNGRFGVQVDANGSRVERTFLNSSIAGPPNTGQEGAGILISMARDVVVDSNRIAGQLGVISAAVSKPSFGVFSIGENNTVTRNQVNGTDEAISFRQSARDTVQDNNASDNLRDGIAAAAGEGVAIVNNTALNNTISGIFLSDARNSTVARNLVMFNNIGIALTEQPGVNNTYRENNVSRNQNGFVLSTGSRPGLPEPGGEDNVFVNNTISLNNFFGIRLVRGFSFELGGEREAPSGVNGSRILNNTISSNGFGGVVLDSANNTTISGNEFLGNGNGVFVDLSNFTTLTGNNITQNVQFGVRVEPRLFRAPNAPNPTGTSVGHVIRGNNVSNNGVGVFLNRSENTVIDANNASFNTEDGIRLQDAPNNSLSNNIARNNARFGVYVNRSDNTPTTGSDARFNGAHGIFYNGTTNLTVTSNTVIGHTGVEDDGIRVQASSQGIVELNTGLNNFHCIHINQSPTVTHVDNDCSNDIVVDPSPLFFLFRNTVTNGGIQILDSPDGASLLNFVHLGLFGFKIVNASNVSLQDDRVSQTQKADLFFVDADITTNNTTFDPEKVVVAGIGNLTVLRSLDVVATAPGGAPIENATVAIFNASGGLVFNGSTNSTGRIPTQSLVQFREDDLRRRPEAPYTITVFKPGFQAATVGTNLTEQVSLTVPLTPEVPFPFGCFQSTPGLRTATLRIQNKTFPVNIPIHSGVMSHPANACENEFHSGAFQFNRTEFINDFGGAPGVCLVTDIYTNRQGNMERLVPLRPCLPPVPPPPPPLTNLPTVVAFQNNKTQDGSKRLTLNTSEEVVLEATFNQTGTFTWKVDGVVEKTEAGVGQSGFSVSFNDSDIHVVTLTVSNANGTSDKLQWIFNVVPMPPPPPPPPPPPVVLFFDNFSLDANNDSIPDGWIPLAGTWQLVNGRLCSSGNTGVAAIYYGASTFSGDLAASADIQLITGFPGVIERFVNPSLFPSHLYGAIYAAPPFFPSDTLGLVEFDGFQQLTFLPIPSGLLPVQRIGGGVRGANLEGTVNGVFVGSAPLIFSPKLNTGFAGLVAVQGDVCFANFEVRTVS